MTAVEILSDTQFSIAGRLGEVGQPRPPIALYSPAPVEGCSRASASLIRTLRDDLYYFWFIRAREAAGPETNVLTYRAHLDNLGKANSGRGCWEPGWKFRRYVDQDRVEVENYGVVFTLNQEQVRLPDQEPTGDRLFRNLGGVPGAPCRVRVPSEARSLLPGFWAAVGDADPWEPDETPWMLRIYWHLSAAVAPDLVHHLTSDLNDSKVPFRLKVVSDPGQYLRADAGVLYLDPDPDQWSRARPVVQRAYREIAGGLRPEVPRLTARLAPGVGFCEGSADGESFGSNRCGLIARALVKAFVSGARTNVSRRQAVAETFRAAGLDPMHPHRARGSRTTYRPLVSKGAPSSRSTGPSAESGEKVDPMDVAAEIGRALCASAYSHDGRCNWVASRPSPDRGGEQSLTALGVDLYAGTSGVALFLAELFRISGEKEYRGIAVGAQRQALSALRAEPGLCRPMAFYEGQLGVAWAARRVAALTEDEKLGREADELLAILVRTLPGDRCPDIIAGSAGAILALLRLGEVIGDTIFLEAAARLGQELLLDPSVNPQAGAAPPLTGFAHGTAGTALALLELAAATGVADFGHLAESLFDYEDACFDKANGNWPDLRERPGADAALMPSFMVAWCHGAPGIALSRLRAMRVDPARASRYEEPALAGLATTVERLERELERPGADPCLCHGLAGMTEVVSLGAELLDEPELRRSASRARELLPALSRAAIRLTDPCLLTGAAGVGYAMLQLSHPERVPSILLPAAVEASRERPRVDTRSGPPRLQPV